MTFLDSQARRRSQIGGNERLSWMFLEYGLDASQRFIASGAQRLEMLSIATVFLQHLFTNTSSLWPCVVCLYL